jgi:2'-5' RNA ligase
VTDAAGPARRPTWREVAAMPGRRLFVAVPLADDAVAAVTRLVERVRDGALPGGRVRGRDVRWVRLDGLHLTLRFIGPTLEERLPAVVHAIRRTASAAGPFDLVIDGGGAFPDPQRPRTLWLGVTDGASELSRLATDLAAELAAAGWPMDDRPFRAHLTLARSDGVPTAAATARRLVEEAAGLALPSRVDRLVLFESITGGGPARYVPVESVPLGGAGA